MIPVALTLAGSDPSGGAGIQADLKTFHACGVYGMSVLTLLTVQNTRGVKKVSILSPSMVAAQLEAVLEDIPPAAAKTGALGNSKVIRAIARAAKSFSFPLVIDPVMISKHGAPLMDRRAVSVLIDQLLPYAFLVTPNLPEAEAMTGLKIRDLETMEQAARKITQFGVKSVLIKGGHLKGSSNDLLLTGGKCSFYKTERIKTRHTHGTGCTFSAAITAELAKGKTLVKAVQFSKQFVTEAIRTSPGLGHGQGPVNHHAKTSRG